MYTLNRSWALTKTTFSVMRQDPEMLVFPVLGSVFSLLFVAVLLVPSIVTQVLADQGGGFSLAFGAVEVVLLFVTYFMLGFFSTFFNTCVVYTAKTRFEGGNSTFFEALSFAMKRLPQIVAWSLVSASVGVLLRSLDQMAEQRGVLGLVMRGVRTVIGITWSLVTLFVIPVMVYEDVGPIEAIKRSTATLKETWGEALVRNVGFGLLQFVAMLPGILAIMGGFALLVGPTMVGGVLLASLGLIWLVCVGMVFSVANVVFNTALYHFARTGTSPSGYDEEYLLGAMRHRISGVLPDPIDYTQRTREAPMITGFTDRDVPSQTGRTFIVTGANSGIGFETAKVLAGRGARVLLGCRSPTRAEDARARIAEAHPDADLTVVLLDLGALDSVRQAAETILAEPRLDGLVNNAGLMMPPRELTQDGFESQLGVNHLGPFALTGLLLPLLERTEGSRIVNTSSNGHRFGSIDFDDLKAERSYNSLGRYGASKLANLLHTYELDRRLRAKGSTTLAVAAHPGGTDTDLFRHLPSLLVKGLRPFARPLLNQPPQGAWPTLLAATAPGVEGGQYFGPSSLGELAGPARQVDSNRASKDAVLARRLWDVSVELTGVDPGLPATGTTV